MSNNKKTTQKPKKISCCAAKLLKLKKINKKIKLLKGKLKVKEKKIRKKVKEIRKFKLKLRELKEKKEKQIKSSIDKKEVKKNKKKQVSEKIKSLEKNEQLPKKTLSANSEGPAINEYKVTSEVLKMKIPLSTAINAKTAITSLRGMSELKEIESFVKSESRVSVLRVASSRKKAINKNKKD